jgi:hypothetical protein
VVTDIRNHSSLLGSFNSAIDGGMTKKLSSIVGVGLYGFAGTKRHSNDSSLSER